MAFDYNKLRGRIVEKYRTNKAFAAAAGISDVTLARKLNNDVDITRKDVMEWKDLLGITPEEVGVYFFTPDVKKTEQEAVQ